MQKVIEQEKHIGHVVLKFNITWFNLETHCPNGKFRVMSKTTSFDNIKILQIF